MSYVGLIQGKKSEHQIRVNTKVVFNSELGEIFTSKTRDEYLSSIRDIFDSRIGKVVKRDPYNRKNVLISFEEEIVSVPLDLLSIYEREEE